MTFPSNVYYNQDRAEIQVANIFNYGTKIEQLFMILNG